MYGTVARLQFKPGMQAEMQAQLDAVARRHVPGIVADYIYQTDADPNVHFLAVVFESKEAYLANAQSPEQHAEFLRLRELLAADPEWHDGTVIRSLA